MHLSQGVTEEPLRRTIEKLDQTALVGGSAPALKPLDGELHLRLSQRARRQHGLNCADSVFFHRVGVIAFDQRSNPDASVRLRRGILFPALLGRFQGKAEPLAFFRGQAFDAEPNVIGAVLHFEAVPLALLPSAHSIERFDASLYDIGHAVKNLAELPFAARYADLETGLSTIPRDVVPLATMQKDCLDILGVD